MSQQQVRIYNALWAALLPVAQQALDAIKAQVEADAGFPVQAYCHDDGECRLGLQLMDEMTPVRELEIRLVSADPSEPALGANIRIVSLKRLDGDWFEHREYAPHHHTDQASTQDAAELLERFRAADLSAFALDMVE